MRPNFLVNQTIMISTETKEDLISKANDLKGSSRRAFMARTVQNLGRGAQRWAEQELGWSRHTIRKGLREINGEIETVDNFSARGRKRAEERLPHLLDDIGEIVGQNGKTDLTGEEVRRRLLNKGYTTDALPSVRTINNKIKALGYR